MEYLLIHKVILRIAKEHKLFNCFKNNYSFRTTEFIFRHLIHSSLPVSLRYTVSYSEQLNNIFSQNVGIIIGRQFNQILFNLLENNIYLFFKKEKIESLFENEISKQNSYKNLKEYVFYCKNNNINPWDLIKHAFNWFKTENGYQFWNQTSDNYREYLLHILIKNSNKYKEDN